MRDFDRDSFNIQHINIKTNVLFYFYGIWDEKKGFHVWCGFSFLYFYKMTNYHDKPLRNGYIIFFSLNFEFYYFVPTILNYQHNADIVYSLSIMNIEYKYIIYVHSVF